MKDKNTLQAGERTHAEKVLNVGGSNVVLIPSKDREDEEFHGEMHVRYVFSGKAGMTFGVMPRQLWDALPESAASYFSTEEQS